MCLDRPDRRQFLRTASGAAAGCVVSFVKPDTFDPSAPSRLLQPSDFSYLGAFTFPTGWMPGYKHFQNSNGAIAYVPTGNAGAGSLMAAGAVVNGNYVAELTIPDPKVDANPDNLNVAEFVGVPFLDATGYGHTKRFLLDMTYNPDDRKIYFCYGSDYDSLALPGSPSLGRFTTLRRNAGGLWYLGKDAAVTEHAFRWGRTITTIPPDWAAAHGIGSRRLLCIRKRGGTSGDDGPHAIAITPPAALRASGVITEWTDLAKYSSAHPISDWNPRNVYMGSQWVEGSRGKQAILVSGLKNFPKKGVRFPDGYYGYEHWTLPSECEPDGACVGGRGWRAADARFGWWMFDPEEYAAVLAGREALDEVNFYLFDQQLNRYAYRSPLPECFATTGSSAEVSHLTYDRANRRLFVSECYVAGPERSVPVVHVFRVA